MFIRTNLSQMLEYIKYLYHNGFSNMGNMGMDLSENRVPPKFNGSSMSTIIFPSNRTIFGYPYLQTSTCHLIEQYTRATILESL